MNRNTRQIIFIFLLFCLTSCEGFKVLVLYNDSDNDIIITTKPALTKFQYGNITNHLDSSIYSISTTILKPDSEIVLTAIFTGMIFNSKIKEKDIKIEYLKIQTMSDTIEAKSKSDIIKLLNNNKTKYKRKLDKTKKLINSKNFGNIIIRK